MMTAQHLKEAQHRYAQFIDCTISEKDTEILLRHDIPVLFAAAEQANGDDKSLVDWMQARCTAGDKIDLEIHGCPDKVCVSFHAAAFAGLDRFWFGVDLREAGAAAMKANL